MISFLIITIIILVHFNPFLLYLDNLTLKEKSLYRNKRMQLLITSSKHSQNTEEKD